MIVAGIGCRKGVSVAEVLAAIEAAIHSHGLATDALSALATTAFKREEEAIFAAGRALGLPVMVVEDAAMESAGLNFPRPPLRPTDLTPGRDVGAMADRNGPPAPPPHKGEEVASAVLNLTSDCPGTAGGARPDEGGVANTLTHSNLSCTLAGTPSVSEAAALTAAGAGAKLLGPRTVLGPVTCAVAIGGDQP